MSLLTDLINLDLSDVTEKIIAEYIWIGGSGMDIRSKGRVSLMKYIDVLLIVALYIFVYFFWYDPFSWSF